VFNRVQLAAIGLIGLTALSCGRAASTKGPESATKRAERRTQTFDFGTARQGAVLHHTFQVANTGKGPVTVGRVQTTCGCTVATVKKDTVVEPGKSLDVPVDLNLRGKHSPVESKVIVNYAGGAIPDELVLKGSVSDEYQDVVTLPKIKRGEQPEQVVTLSTYPGQPPLAVQDIAFDPAKFEVTSRPGAKEGTVDVVLKPALGAPYGPVMDRVVIKTNDTEAPEKPIAVRAHVLKPLEATKPRLILHPGKEGEPVAGTAEFKSTYGGPISGVTVSITREKRFEVSVEPNSPADTVRVRVAVKPTEKMKKPFVQATLKVTAKVGDEDVDEKMTVVYSVDEKVPGERDEGDDSETEDAGADAGKH